jgi:hypothetical protein
MVLNKGLSFLFFETITDYCIEGKTFSSSALAVNPGELSEDGAKVFSFAAFNAEFYDLKPSGYLPKKLPDFWLNQILDICYAGDELAYPESQRIVAFICIVLGGCGDISREPVDGKKVDSCIVRYMMELKHEQLARLGAISYKPATTTDIFKPSRNSKLGTGVKLLNHEILHAVEARHDQFVF